MKPGQTFELELTRINEFNQGVGFKFGKLIIVDKVEDEEKSVKVEITRILEETVFTRKIEKSPGRPPKNRKDLVDSPYQTEGEDEEDG